MKVKVKELLERKGTDIWSVSPDATVFSGLQLMADKNIGAVLVIEGDKLVGIFSERDYARKVVLAGLSSKDTAISELMTTDVVTVGPDTIVQECLGLMTEHRVRHLPVVEDEKLLGILTIGDVVKHLIRQLEVTVRDLENYITGSGYGS
jgi:CBS domain-containing protein